MRLGKKPRGFLLIVAAVLIAVAAVMAAIIVTLTAGSGRSGGLHLGSTQAFFAAESGLERALRGLTKEAVACTALTYSGTLAIGGRSANYSTTGTLYVPAATQLAADIDNAVTVIPVASVTGYAPHGRIAIGSEFIHYTGVSTDTAVCGGSSACFIGATRGAGGSAAASHNAGDTVTQNQCLIRSVATSSEGTQRTVERAVTASVGSTVAMIVYVHENTPGVPYYRLWDGTAWGAEQAASSVGSRIRFMVLKSARTRNESILVTQSENGEIRAQIWNGSFWSDGATQGATRLLGTVANNGDRHYRAFDVEYEAASDRAMVVYRNGNNSDPDYRIWTGAGWTTPATVTPNATTGRPRWIELAANPNALSNEIVMLIVDHKNDVHGTRWTGAGWVNMESSPGIWDNNTASSTTKVIDVTYEQNGSQRAMFLWADNFNCTLRWRTWDSGSGVLGTPQSAGPWSGCTGDRARWVKLAADPRSDDIMLGVQDNDRDLSTCLWNGSSWDCSTAIHPEHNTNVESDSNRSFDIVFATDLAASGQAWLVFGSRSGLYIGRRRWTGASWVAVSNQLGSDACITHLYAHPVSGVIFAGIYENIDTGNISVTQLIGGVWSAPLTLWGPGTLGCKSSRVHERVAIAPAGGGALALFDWLEIFP